MEESDVLTFALQAEFDAIDEASKESGIDSVDLQLAHRYGRSIGRRNQEIAAVKTYALSETARLIRERERIENWLGAAAAAAVARMVQGRKKKSITTPWGVMGLRKQGRASVEYLPAAKSLLIEWCREHCPEAISETTPTPTEGILKEVLAAHLADTGEFCPDAQLTEAGREVFFLRGAKEKEDASG